ncbi:hypothetical protein [Streptomyces sp. NPDC005538]|uniref:hypothetical protein n=1 Tax=unclassified Streptomyces TaxID=2593676 RepID=UPI0033B6AC93
MTVLMDRHRPARKGVLALMAAALLLVVMTLTAQSSTTAAAATGELPSPASDVGIAAWTPTVSPLYTNSLPAEHVYRNQTNAQRSYYLNNCPRGYLCISVGQGDGLHTVFQLYYCAERTLGAFIDAGGVTNNQTGDASAFFTSADGTTWEYIPANNVPYSFNPYPYDYLWPCGF